MVYPVDDGRRTSRTEPPAQSPDVEIAGRRSRRRDRITNSSPPASCPSGGFARMYFSKRSRIPARPLPKHTGPRLGQTRRFRFNRSRRLDRSDPSLGAGEGSLPPVSAALANAFAHASVRRLPELPMTPERVKALQTPGKSPAVTEWLYLQLHKNAASYPEGQSCNITGCYMLMNEARPERSASGFFVFRLAFTISL
jgi:hypothetical protein